VLRSVSRAGLNLVLIEAAAEYPSVRLNFDGRCTGVDLNERTFDVASATTHDMPGAHRASISFELLIGADGAYSAVRAAMQKQERFNFQQDYLSHGYKELTIPAGAGGSFQMEKNALHIWPRHSFMMIALPNSDGSFTCTLFWPYEGANSFAALKTEADVRRFFSEQFADAVPLMPSLAEDYFQNPVGPLVTMRCAPWHVDGRVALLGDAAHAVVPFLGQGMNAAFEDCTVLAQCLAKRADSADALRAYDNQRKEHADDLADMAIDNFLEMRDKVASRWFRWRKKLQILLYKLMPAWYVPLYNLIQFTTTPYAEARRRVARREQITRTVGVGLTLVLLLVVLWFAR